MAHVMIRSTMEAAAVHAEVDRLLRSATFRNSEVLRRLLKFLEEKSVAGEADQLKEYTIAVDGLGKPTSYDPRQDSVVRIEIGRLRTKLTDYYRTEGENDPVVLTIPKGHFKLTWTKGPPLLQSAPSPPTSSTPSTMAWSSTQISLTIVLTAWALIATTLQWQARRGTRPLGEAWSPALRELWGPIIESRRPLVVAVSAPLFVGFQGHGFYRDQDLNEWQDALASPKVQAIGNALNNPPIVPRFYYTGLGEMSASFALGKLFGNSGLDVATTWSNLLSWQQIADNDVLFVGPPRVFGDELRKLPVRLDFALEHDGVRDVKAKANEPVLFADNYPSIDAHQLSVSDDGEVYALVSRMPGPLGSGYVLSFSSNHSPGTEGAVEFFTVPKFASQLTAELHKSDGHVPRYFQLVIKVRYRDAIPIEISYVTHRDLQLENTGNNSSYASSP